MKRKLILAAFAALVGLCVKAQQTPSNGGVYYLYNTETGKFLTRGRNWGTQAVTNEVGQPWHVTISDGKYTLRMYDIYVAEGNNHDNRALGNNGFSDNDNSANHMKWELVGSASGYQIKSGDNYLISPNTYGDNVIATSGNKTWQFLNVDEYKAVLANKKSTQETAVATSASLSLGGSTLTEYLTENYRGIAPDATAPFPSKSTWSHDGVPNRGGNDNEGSYGVETYQGGRTYAYTVTGLKKGIYKVGVRAMFRSTSNAACYTLGQAGYVNSSAYFSANGNIVQIKDWYSSCTSADNPNSTDAFVTIANNGGYYSEVYTYVGDDGKLDLKAVSEAHWGANWFLFNGVTITYYTDQIEDDDITALISTIPTNIPSAVASNLGTLRSTLESTKKISDYNALSAAITSANSLVSYYNAFQEMKENATIAGVASSTISTQTDAMNAATTAEGIQTATAALKTAAEACTAYEITTFTIGNPTAQTLDGGWDGTTFGGQSDGVTEYWNASGADFHQTISNLPAGNYRLKVIALQRTGRTGTVYAGSKHTTIAQVGNPPVNNRAQAATWFNEGNGVNYVYFTLASTSDVTIGLTADAVTADYWTVWKGFTLETFTEGVAASYLEPGFAALVEEATDNYNSATYESVVGAEKTALYNAINATPSTVAEYEEATSALVSANATFIAAVGDYALLAIEKTKAASLGMTTEAINAAASTSKTGLKATQDLKVAEYNFVATNYSYAVDLGVWNASDNAGTMSSQHWDGTKESTYLEQGSGDKAYNLSSWTVTYDQNLNLPAGNYVFKVAGRTASNHVTINLNVTDITDAENPNVLGTVNDFPKGDVGLGINKSGVTSFDPEDAAGFANNGAGRGWEWRYVKFTLASDATVKVEVRAEADAQYRWMGFCNATVQTDNAATNALIAYNIAFAAATAARDNATYKYVNGTDKSNLLDAIAADASLDKSDVDAVNAATTALTTATTTFTANPAAWNAYTIAKNTSYADDQPYASADKYAAIATAKAAAAPNTAAEAATKAADITAAYRQYIESNALAEGVVGAVNKTNLISDPNMEVTYDGTAHTFGAWQVFGQTDGTIQLLSGESFTDGNGKNDYKYADIWKSDNNAGIKQTLANLPTGKYMLTATARGKVIDGATFGLFAGDARTEINRIGNTKGVFDRGWNDVSVEFSVTETSDVEIGVQSGNGKDLWWSATRFRLVKLPSQPVSLNELSDQDENIASNHGEVANVELYRTIKEGFNTVCLPFNLTASQVQDLFGTDSKVYEFSDEGVDADHVTVNFTTVNASTIAANTPVLVYATSASSANVISDVCIAYSLAPKVEGTYFEFVGTYDDGDVAAGDYYIGGGKLYKSQGDVTIKPFRAYLKAKAAVEVKMFIDDVETSINSIMDVPAANAPIYTLAGQRVSKAVKGLYIVNGKKVVIK